MGSASLAMSAPRNGTTAEEWLGEVIRTNYRSYFDSIWQRLRAVMQRMQTAYVSADPGG